MEARIYQSAWNRLYNHPDTTFKTKSLMDDALNQTMREELDNQEFQNLPKGEEN